MRILTYISLCILLTLGVSCSKGVKEEYKTSPSFLKFNDRGEFKIAQFTDIHWDEKALNNDSTIAVIKNVLATETPDLAILSGDIVCAEPAVDGWLSISKIFAENNIPWVVLMGNHDEEQELTRQQIDSLLQNQTNYITSDKLGAESESGDFYLTIKSAANDNNAAVVYCLNSNHYPQNGLLYGTYDWIQLNQVDWYRKYSQVLTEQNGGKPLPALAYFHIPTPEYNDLIRKGSYYGVKNESKASSPDVNSGFVAAAIGAGDVMGTFVGHDHDNCFVGQLYDIALTYGRVSGLNAYGDLDRGARIVKLYEGKRQFDTWIRTNGGQSEMYYYPSGVTQTDEETIKYMDAIPVENLKQGVKYKYFEYEGKIETVEKLADKTISTLLDEGVLKNFSLEQAKRKDYFGLEFEAWLKIPKDGIYKFYTYSDDGSALYINDQPIVDNDGSHSAARVDAKIGLKAGCHKIKLKYFESYMGEHIEVGISSRDILETVIPDDMLYTVE